MKARRRSDGSLGALLLESLLFVGLLGFESLPAGPQPRGRALAVAARLSHLSGRVPAVELALAAGLSVEQLAAELLAHRRGG